MNEIATEARADFIRDVAAIKTRLTNGELHAHQRAVRDGIDALEQQPQPAYRHHVAAAVECIGYELDEWAKVPTVTLCSPTDVAIFVAELFIWFAQHETRVMKAVRESMRVHPCERQLAVSFELEREPADGIPYEAAA